MLILTRRTGQKIMIGDNIILKLLNIQPNRIKIEITKRYFIFSLIKTKELILKSFDSDALEIEKNIRITFLKCDAYRASIQASIGIDAPRSISVHRLEIYQRIKHGEHKAA